MTSLQRLSRQWASASKSFKHCRQRVMEPWMVEASARHCFICVKRALSFQHTTSFSFQNPKYSALGTQASSFKRTLCSHQLNQVYGKDLYSLSSLEQKGPKNVSFVEDDAVYKKFSEDLWERTFQETSYYFEGGLRHVYPYYNTYRVNVRGKWVDRTVEDALKSSFESQWDYPWVERDILDGTLLINGLTTSKDYVLQLKDKIEHLVHRHELPVTGRKIDILYCDPHIIVVNKPPCLVIHPTGKYKHNTALFVVARENKMLDLRVTFRLDMGASGVLVFTRSKSAAIYFSKHMLQERKAMKTYLARVTGCFPEGLVSCDVPLAPVHDRTKIMGPCNWGKESFTTFEIMSYNSKNDTSVVLCKPHTGRTHQIRVHLQYLGYPIHNDQLYNSTAFGPERGKGGNFPISLKSIYDKWQPDRSRWDYAENARSKDFVFEPWIAKAKSPTIDSTKFVIDKKCELCPLHLIVNPRDLGFHLHALEYKGEDWSFCSPLPEWALPDWDELED